MFGMVCYAFLEHPVYTKIFSVLVRPGLKLKFDFACHKGSTVRETIAGPCSTGKLNVFLENILQVDILLHF